MIFCKMKESASDERNRHRMKEIVIKNEKNRQLDAENLLGGE